MSRRWNLPTELTVFLVGIIATWASLTLGLFGGRPLITLLAGPPLGVGEDYTTWQSVAQAIVAQAVFLIPVFAFCGYSLGSRLSHRSDIVTALLFANPLNVFCGYWIYYESFYTGWNLNMELFYFRIGGAIFWSLASVVLLSPAALLGLRFRRPAT